MTLSIPIYPPRKQMYDHMPALTFSQEAYITHEITKQEMVSALIEKEAVSTARKTETVGDSNFEIMDTKSRNIVLDELDEKDLQNLRLLNKSYKKLMDPLVVHLIFASLKKLEWHLSCVFRRPPICTKEHVDQQEAFNIDFDFRGVFKPMVKKVEDVPENLRHGCAAMLFDQFNKYIQEMNERHWAKDVIACFKSYYVFIIMRDVEPNGKELPNKIKQRVCEIKLTAHDNLASIMKLEKACRQQREKEFKAWDNGLNLLHDRKNVFREVIDPEYAKNKHNIAEILYFG